MAEQRISYTGERIDVGIDVHKETYTVTCLCQRPMVKTATVPADPVRLAESLPRWFPGARIFSAYEAGFSGFVLHRVLTTAGITNIVVNPASVAVAANDKVKTDRRDAKKLARDLADGRLRGIYVPTTAEELARLLVWSKNPNAPFSRSLWANHRPLLALQSTALWPILTTSERQQLGWNDSWIGSNSWHRSRAPSMRNSACATRTW